MPLSPRTAALSGVAGIVLLDVGWFWDPAAPFASDARIADWYAVHGDTSWLAAAAVTVLAAPLLWIFAVGVRDRLAAGGASRTLQAVAAGAGKVFALTVLVFGLLYAAIPLSRVLTVVGAPSGAVSRFWDAAVFGEYIVASTLSAAVLIAAVSVAALRRRGVPLGLGIAGIPLVVLTLATPVLPMAGITLWFLVSGITLAVSRPAGSRPAVPQPARVPAAL
jgi:hypothetical protein